MNKRNIDPFLSLKRIGAAIDVEIALHVTSTSWIYGVDPNDFQLLDSDNALDELMEVWEQGE